MDFKQTQKQILSDKDFSNNALSASQPSVLIDVFQFVSNQAEFLGGKSQTNQQPAVVAQQADTTVAQETENISTASFIPAVIATDTIAPLDTASNPITLDTCCTTNDSQTTNIDSLNSLTTTTDTGTSPELLTGTVDFANGNIIATDPVITIDSTDTRGNDAVNADNQTSDNSISEGNLEANGNTSSYITETVVPIDYIAEPITYPLLDYYPIPLIEPWYGYNDGGVISCGVDNRSDAIILNATDVQAPPLTLLGAPDIQIQML